MSIYIYAFMYALFMVSDVIFIMRIQTFESVVSFLMARDIRFIISWNLWTCSNENSFSKFSSFFNVIASKVLSDLVVI